MDDDNDNIEISVPIYKLETEYKKVPVVSGYKLFFREYYPYVKKQHPELNFGDISIRLGKIWKEMTENDKYVFRDRQNNINFPNR